MRTFIARTLACAALASSLFAAPARPAAAADACITPGFKQMNFLLGTWIVSTPDGMVIGHDSLIHGLGNCGFYDYYRDAAGNHRSFAIFSYQPGAASWHLDWLDDSSLNANMDGSPTHTSLMSMDGADYMGAHRRLHHIEYNMLPDGTMEKIWKSSSDEGRHWAVTFDGIYRREKI